MPTYEYKCENGHVYVEIRSISATDGNTTCGEAGCDGKLNRVYSAPPITFKGSGFNAKSG